MPFIPRIPSRVTRFIIPAVHSLPAPHIQPHYNGRHSTGTYTGFRRRISQHQQPLERPEIVRLPPQQEIEYADAAVRAVVHENVNEALAAGNNVHINEDGSKVYLYKQSDGKEVLVTVAVVGEGVAGVGTTVATGGEFSYFNLLYYIIFTLSIIPLKIENFETDLDWVLSC
ncbi:hypothetical protein TWF225_001407 [Orbilia oligospora]|uniref:Uncharacterized protein n=1 Tax=Orbilia oligospora TaxID=2813651 RepID=A0A7C8KGC9_ORBOL|nr:hypothetical protein TWF751_008943 [Orbilia oligospora]KAF3191261.1 hypothetical protein TWF225_001407 [Orbilia oligospora]KAF3269437.1 hypothetical protein TWF128_005663 [Orbilia oligospora]KAF3296656.1 hypothetical protein TWF132_010241 [Orbilia oligospora]TGJ66120.1 hypothetical protein EYR41_007771 [Orbilia oligospora]